MNKEELLEILHADRKSYIAEVGLHEYECLESLVEDDYIKSIEALKAYGVAIPEKYLTN